MSQYRHTILSKKAFLLKRKLLKKIKYKLINFTNCNGNYLNIISYLFIFNANIFILYISSSNKQNHISSFIYLKLNI